MTYSLIVLTAFVSIYSIALAYIDYAKIKSDVIIYKRQKNRRGFYVVLLNFTIGFALNYRYGVSWFVCSIYAQTIYWFVFDLSLNLLRGLPVTYTSNNGRDDQDALTDKVFNWMSKEDAGLIQVFVKALIIGSCITYFIYG